MFDCYYCYNFLNDVFTDSSEILVKLTKCSLSVAIVSKKNNDAKICKFSRHVIVVAIIRSL